jgi:heme/copper-type cytochrome/quinol oxidase subunit 2
VATRIGRPAGFLTAAFLISATLFSPAVHPDDATSVVISRDRFSPGEIQARKGETLRLSVTASDEEHCLAVDELRIEKRVRPGRATRLEITPDRSGQFLIYCCLESRDKGPRGWLIVSD